MTAGRESLVTARLDDGSTVAFPGITKLDQLHSALENSPHSIGGEMAQRQGFRHFALQWWLPTERGVVPLRRVVEFIEAGQ